MADDGGSDDQTLQRLREAALNTAVQQLRVIHELRRTHQGTPALGSGSAPASAGGKPKTTASDFLFDLARLSLGNYEAWLKVSGNHFDFIADSLRHLSGKPSSEPAAHRLELTTYGKIGHAAHARFVLENPDEAKMGVSITAQEFRAADGSRLDARVEYHRVAPDDTPLPPGDLVLFPREAARIGVAIAIAPGAAAGHYRAEGFVLVGARVAGQLAINLDVTT